MGEGRRTWKQRAGQWREAVGRPELPGGWCDERGLAPGQRWSVARKREVVLRLLRGESVEGLSRELGVEIYRLEKWRDKGLSGIDAGLKEREGDPVQAGLDAAMKRVGELTMQNELLWQRVRKPGLWPRGGRRNEPDGLRGFR